MSADKVASMQKQLSEMDQKLAGASQTEASAKLEISKVSSLWCTLTPWLLLSRAQINTQ